jgi:hypothetical protein
MMWNDRVVDSASSPVAAAPSAASGCEAKDEQQ